MENTRRERGKALWMFALAMPGIVMIMFPQAWVEIVGFVVAAGLPLMLGRWVPEWCVKLTDCIDDTIFDE